MESYKPVLWYQGLFLQPQHFQHFDLYLQSLLAPLRTYQHPYFWGICRMDVRQEALKNRIFDISQGEFIFQDGTWIVIPDNAVIIPRSLQNEKLEAGKPYKVFIGLRTWNHLRENVTIVKKPDDLESAGTRFVAPVDPEEIRDIHQGGPPANIKLMRYVLRVFLESEIESLVDYCFMPVAELEYDENEIKISPNFISPAVSIASSEALRQIILSIREQITSRCRKLEEYKSPRGIQSSHVEISYIIYMLALRSLNRYVPLLHHVTEVPNIHPWNVYGLLRIIIGELSTYTDRIDALGRLMDGTELLPQYNHENLRHCFDEAQVLIGELLSTIVIGPESIIHLKRENGFFKAQIPLELFSASYTFFLVLRTAEKQNRVLEVMKHIAKVSSVEYMATLIRRALPGISLVHSLIPPPGLPTRPNSFYFELDQTHNQWVEIQKSQSICLYWDQAPKDTKAELIVLRR